MTALEIFLVVFLKGALVALLIKFGKWPDWEENARIREDEKALLRAYKKWRKDAGPGPAAQLRVVCDEFTGPKNSFWSIRKRSS